ncbi:uncharacterized protein OCT59_015251 [Rhizophagus irregularis]|uniref:uncharacterized protein n=1 Tax=Rhizophagus irregularis TaxID=588596 RepID=UPI003320734A|nr:hypothetical protein OCT59_015251 [Rhizophagus irregularis]
MLVIGKLFVKSGNAIIDDFILKKKLKWFPYYKFKNVKYLKEGGFGTIYKAIWLKNNGDEEDEEDEEGKEVILKCPKNLNENLNEFLKEWEYHTSVLTSSDIIDVYGFTEDLNTSKYMVVMAYANKGERPEIIENTPQCYVNLMKKCWNEDPLKRPSALEVKDIIDNWIFYPYEVSEELKSNIIEFINAPIGRNKLATKSHSKACYTSRLLDFTSKKLNEVLESENLQAYCASHSDLNDCVINDSRSLDESTSKLLNEILESEDSQATSVKANKVLVSEDMSDYIIKDLGSLDIKPDEN